MSPLPTRLSIGIAVLVVAPGVSAPGSATARHDPTAISTFDSERVDGAAQADRIPSAVRIAAGTGASGYTGDGGPATAATLSAVEDVALDERGRLWVLDTYNNAVRRVDVDGTIRTVVPPSAGLLFPFDIAVRGDRIVVADSYNQRIVEVDESGSLTTIAGTGVAGYSGEGGDATQAQLRFPFGVDLTPDGRVLVADTFNHRVREIDRDGTIRTVLGTGVAGYSGDGGPASAAQVNLPYDVAWAGGRRVAIADTQNHRVRLLDRGFVSTVLGTGETGLADTGTARTSRVWSPSGVAARPDGTLAVADFRNDRIVMVRRDRLDVLATGDDVAVRGGVSISRDGRTVAWADTFRNRVSLVDVRQ